MRECGIRGCCWWVRRCGGEVEAGAWRFRKGRESREVCLFLFDYYPVHVRERRCRRQGVQRGQRNWGRRRRRPLPIPLLRSFIPPLLRFFSLHLPLLLPLMPLPRLPFSHPIHPPPPHPPHSRLPRRLQRPGALLEVVLDDEPLDLRCEFVEERGGCGGADGLGAREGGMVRC